MNKKVTNVNKAKIPNSSHTSIKSDAVNKNEEAFIIPNEGACSPEFPEGCIILEDENDKIF